MRPFDLAAAEGATADARYLAGGTQLVDLMRLGVEAPQTLTDLGWLRDDLGQIEAVPDGLRIGALATMAGVASHPLAARHPALVQSLRLAASPQIRNMGTIGGCILQRTRCGYFRSAHGACNKRNPGSGCSAIGGDARGLAILGASDACIANYPGDLAVALVALGAEMDLRAPDGIARTVPVEGFHRRPGTTPHIESILAPGELIESIVIPDGSWTGQSYAKARDRRSYAFALASAAVAIRVADGVVVQARIALGGLAAVPWRCGMAEEILVGRRINEDTALEIGRLCLRDAAPTPDQVFKTALGARVVARALIDAVGH